MVHGPMTTPAEHRRTKEAEGGRAQGRAHRARAWAQRQRRRGHPQRRRRRISFVAENSDFAGELAALAKCGAHLRDHCKEANIYFSCNFLVAKGDSRRNKYDGEWHSVYVAGVISRRVPGGQGGGYLHK